MKKSILFGALAMFAIGALSIQNVNAQTPVKVKKTETTTVSETADTPNATTVKQEPVKQKKGDCCDSKQVSADNKKTDCCAADNAKTTEKKPNAEKKAVKEGKRVRKHDGKRADAQKAKTRKVSRPQSEK